MGQLSEVGGSWQTEGTHLLCVFARLASHTPYIMDGGQEDLEASTSHLPQHVPPALLRMDHQPAEGEIPEAVDAALHSLPSCVLATGDSSSRVL